MTFTESSDFCIIFPPFCYLIVAYKFWTGLPRPLQHMRGYRYEIYVYADILYVYHHVYQSSRDRAASFSVWNVVLRRDSTYWLWVCATIWPERGGGGGAGICCWNVVWKNEKNIRYKSSSANIIYLNGLT